nr:hypothetical protein [Cardiobacterium hominis]
MAGNILGVVAVECAIDRGVVRLAGEFVAVNRGIERARYEIALLPRFGEIQLQFLVGEIGMLIPRAIFAGKTRHKCDAEKLQL